MSKLILMVLRFAENAADLAIGPGVMITASAVDKRRFLKWKMKSFENKITFLANFIIA